MDLKIAPFPKTQLMSSFLEIMKISNSQFGMIFFHKFLPVLRLSLKEITFKKLENLNNEWMDLIIEKYRSLKTLVIINVKKLSRRCVKLLKSLPSIKSLMEAC